MREGAQQLRAVRRVRDLDMELHTVEPAHIVGDGGGSEARFNTGSHLTVNVALTDGSTAAPTCKPDDGETGETNNLNLGACTVSGGSTPSATFTESN